MLTKTPFYLASLQDVHEKLLAHPLAQGYLGGSEFRLDGADGAGLTVALPFGELDHTEFAHLFAVFDGSRVHAQKERPGSLAPEGMYFTVVNSRLLQYKNKIGLVELEGEGAGLHLPHQLFIDQFFLQADAPDLLGTVSFALCAITAHLCGLGFIELIAGGGVGFNEKLHGYCVWPKLGFDAPLEPGEAPAHVPAAQSVLDIVEVDAQWWEEHGSQRLMTFELESDSRSWSKLLSYLHAKGILE